MISQFFFRFKAIASVAVLVFLFQSCVLYRTGNISGTAVPGRYDRYVSLVRGDARSISVFGLGGMRRDALVQEARSAMMQTRPLADNEYYNNYNFTFSKKMLLMVGIDKATVCADVMRHCDSISTDLYSKEYRTLAGLPDMKNNLIQGKDTFEIGEAVYVVETTEKYQKRAYSLAYFNNEYVYLRPLYKFKRTIRKPLGPIDLFHQAKTVAGFACGDSVLVRDALFEAKYEKGVIVGTTNTDALIQHGGVFVIAGYNRLKK